LRKLISKMPQSIRQMAIYGTALVFTKAMSLLMVPVFTNFLDPADYGRLDVLQTLANLLSILIAFGLSESLFRFGGEASSETTRRKIAAGIFGIAMIIGIFSLGVTQLAASLLTNMLPGGVTETQVRLILGSLAFSGIILVPMSWLRMGDRALAYTMASAGCALIQALLSALLLYLGYGIEGVLFSGLLCMACLALILGYGHFRDVGIRFQHALYPKTGHFGGVLICAGIAAFIMDSFPRWILAGTAGPADMAIFALAAKLAMIAGFLTHPFEMWWMPRRFAVLNDTNGLTKCARAAEMGVVAALAAALLVSATAPAIITFLTPAEYHGAVLYVPALALLMAMNAIIRLFDIGCLSKANTLSPLAIDSIAASVACGGYFLAIPVWGAWGAISVTAIAMTGRMLAYLIIGHRVKAIPYAFGKLGSLALVTILSCIWMTVITDNITHVSVGLFATSVFILLALCLGVFPISKFMSPRLNNHVGAS
jgi:O-antigen/teichoic acid export membrane protein